MLWHIRLRPSATFVIAAFSLAVACDLVICPIAARAVDRRPPVQSAVPQPPAIPDFAKNVQVRISGKLVPLDKAIRQMAADRQQQMYRQLRTANATTATGQLEIARWCQQQKMDEEEQFHWWTLLGMQPGHPEAIKGLRLHRFQGLLLTSDEIDQLKKQQKDVAQAAKQWTPKLKKLKQAIEHGEIEERESALNELKSIRDPLAIPSIDKVFGFDEVRIGQQLIEMAVNMPDDDGAGFLVRLAVNSTDEYVRDKAAGALKNRPYATYVPILIAGLAAPIEMSARVSVDSGQPTYEWYEGQQYTGRLVQGSFPLVYRLHSKYQPSDFAYFWSPETRRIAGWRNTGQSPDRLRYDYQLSRDSPNPDVPYEQSGAIDGLNHAGTRNRGAKNFEKSVAQLDKEVKEANERTAALNQRIHAALTKATGAQIGSEGPGVDPTKMDVKPRLWWDWWRTKSHPNEHFEQGTAVWTQVGPMPVEQILPGDRVLSRDVKSDELFFSLVVATSSQTKGAVQVIDVDSRTIVATPEQRFRVTGAGWRAANELKADMQLDGLAGPRRIEKVSSGEAIARCSLEIADAPNFFVDRIGILVHDATSRESRFKWPPPSFSAKN